MRIRVGDFRLGNEEKKAIQEVIDSGRISEGRKTREFEEEFAKYIGTKYCVALNSGTSALIAGLFALRHHSKFKIEVLSKVITSPLTYVATSNAIVLSGLEPTFVDIDRQTFIITPENIKSLLFDRRWSKGVKIILPVHLIGYPCNMNAINKIAQENNLITVEDSAQAHGTLYDGKKTGSLSLFAIFSFYIAHNIQAGELGALTTNDAEIFKLVKSIKANGRICDCAVCRRNEGECPRMGKLDDDDSDPRFTHNLIGFNFKILEFQAALGLIQLKKVDWIIEKRSENVKYLNQHLSNFADILQTPVYKPEVSYLAYPLVLNNRKRINRNKLRIELEKRGIETRPLFGCIPTQQPAYHHLKKIYQNRLPNADYIGANGFYIGCHQYLTKEDLDYIIKSFREILK